MLAAVMKEGIVTEIPAPARPFIDRFCHRYGVPREGAERRLLMRCVPIWKRGIWYLMERLVPQAFEHDWEAIHESSQAGTMRDIVMAVQALRYRRRATPHFINSQLSIRISGRRLQKIAELCFEKS